MTLETDPAIGTRILNVLQHFDISKAHVAARDLCDWQRLATSHADQLASLTLLCPGTLVPQVLGPLAARSLMMTGDQGSPTEEAQRLAADFPLVAHVADDVIKA